MSTEEGNRLYLVCEAHQTLSDALELGERHGQRYAPQSILARRADGWFMRHAPCGPGDHFKLAYAQPQNWDYSPPAPPVANAVRLALVNGSRDILGQEIDSGGE